METTANKDKDTVIHVLLADDEHNIVFVNKMVLEQMGYAVFPAYSGREALALMEEHRDLVDVIVTDYLMPGMNGIELAAEVRKFITDTPIILYTGKAEYIDEQQITDAGITRVVVKPFKMKDLDLLIRDMLNAG